MIQLYAWTNVRQSYCIDDEGKSLHEIKSKIHSIIDKYTWLKEPGLGSINF